MTTGNRYATTLAAFGLMLATATSAAAICDVIPQPEVLFQGATANVNRVYAGEGDVVALSRDAAGCDAGTPDFGVTPASDRIVTLVFTPPGGPATAVVLGDGTYCAAGNWVSGGHQAACEAQLGAGGVAFCDTSGAVSGGGDDLAFRLRSQGRTGPVKIAVSDSSGAPICQIASQACSAQAGLSACIDELFEADTCETDVVNRHRGFPGVTALPSWNDFQGICDSSDPSIPCNNTGDDVAFTTDADGNAIVPMDWRGVLVQGTVPIPRLVAASTLIPAFIGTPPEPGQTPGAPPEIPGYGFLQSFSPKGLEVDPLFNPLLNPDAPDTELFGSADAEFGVIRVMRSSPEFRQCLDSDRAGLPCIDDLECPNSSCVAALCRGGSNDGQGCTGPAGCPGGECGGPLFDFGDRYSDVGGTSEVGPVLITSAEYTAEALNPAAIDGLVATDDLFMFVRSEPLEAKDLNLDGDQMDTTVVTLRDAATGEDFEIGAGGPGAVGPAGLRVRETFFRFPAVSVEDDVVALLESEQDEGATDANTDGDAADAILRVFRLDPGGPVELTAGENRASDVATLVGRESLTVSDGLVFFRESEAAGTARVLGELDPGYGGTSTDPYREGHMTPDGRYIAVITQADNLVQGDNDGDYDVFVVDRDFDGNGIFDEPTPPPVWPPPYPPPNTLAVMINVESDGTQPAGPDDPRGVRITPDGRFVIFGSELQLEGNVPSWEESPWGLDAYVHDRDADEDGIYDEPGAISVTILSADVPGCTESICEIRSPQISDDGRHAAFRTRNTFLFDLSPEGEIFLHDRDADENGVLDDVVTTTNVADLFGGLPGLSESGPTMTRDGRFVAIATTMQLDPGDTETTNTLFDGASGDVYVIDRDSDGNGDLDDPGGVTASIATVTTGGAHLEVNTVHSPRLSEDGRFVAFYADNELLAPADGDSESRWYLRDRDVDEDGNFDETRAVLIRRIVRSQTTRAAGDVWREEQFASRGTGLEMSADGRYAAIFSEHMTGSSDNAIDLIDLKTDIADQIAGLPGPGGDLAGILGTATGLLHYSFSAEGTNKKLILGGIDTADLSNDLNADGDVGDLMLAVADARNAAPIAIDVLGPADDVTVSDGNAVFLMPERANGAGTLLNGDLDTDDRVVHLYRNRQAGAAVNLGLAAEGLAVSDTAVAALVSEAGEGAFLNGDGDQDDLVVYVNDLATATSGTWTSLFLAADRVGASGPYVAFTIPEADQGTSQNGDGDTDDRVLRIYDTGSASFVQLVDEFGTPHVGFAVDDFVMSDGVVAFRVNEFDQGQNLNGVAPPIPGGVADGDLLDSVMHIADLSTGRVFNSHQAAIPCPVEACDPRIPYRLTGTKVTFLTLESEQGGNDLDQNGDLGSGLVIQHFNPDALVAGGDMGDACDVLGGALGGVCTGTGDACATDLDCPVSEECFTPPGACLLDLATACELDPDEAPALPDCPTGQLCVPVSGSPGQGSCHWFQGPCLGDGWCTGGATCEDDGINAEELFSAIGEEDDGRQRFVSRGVCSDSDGTCFGDADCNPGATCDGTEVFLASAPDGDADGLADPIDNCPDVANGDQLDVDGDGIGDACDRQSCGNGIQEYTEGCDHGLDNGIDGLCDASCAYVGGGTACSDGVDNDGDGKIDTGDPGCASGADTSERDAAMVCDDGKDNDGDYGSDVGGDPGCGASPNSIREDPACNDGIDNEGDGKVDYDGYGGFYEPDPNCPTANKNKETARACGLGFELLFLLPALIRLRTLRNRRQAN